MNTTQTSNEIPPSNQAKAPLPKKPIARKTQVNKPARKEARQTTKTEAKMVDKAAVKPAQLAVAKSMPPTPAAPEKTTKTKKPKMVRDSFSFPKAEYSVLQELKERSIRLTSPAKKTEILRAAIKTLASLDDQAFLAAIQSIPSLKTGRPAKNSN